MHFNPLSWLLAAVAAALVGLSKTGIPGVSIPSIWLMAEAFGPDARLSVGAITPLLVVADVFAVAFYRRHAQWKMLWRLCPFVIAGMIPAMVLLGYASNAVMKPVLGWLILIVLTLELCRQRFQWQNVPHAWWFLGSMGFLAGFGTALGNAAGPVMGLYLVAVGLPKEQFMGTSAWFFFLVNVSKIPFYIGLEMVTVQTTLFDLWLVPVVVLSSLLGAAILPRIPQRLFNATVMILAAVGAVRLILA